VLRAKLLTSSSLSMDARLELDTPAAASMSTNDSTASVCTEAMLTVARISESEGEVGEVGEKSEGGVGGWDYNGFTHDGMNEDCQDSDEEDDAELWDGWGLENAAENTVENTSCIRDRGHSFNAHIAQPTSPASNVIGNCPATPPEPQRHPLGERRLKSVLERSQRTCLKLWKPRSLSAACRGWNEDRLFDKYSRTKDWDARATRIFEALYIWREETARLADESAHYVCPSDLLIDAARTPPLSVDALQRIAMPLPPVLGDGTTEFARRLIQSVKAAMASYEQETTQAGSRGLGERRFSVTASPNCPLGELLEEEHSRNDDPLDEGGEAKGDVEGHEKEKPEIIRDPKMATGTPLAVAVGVAAVLAVFVVVVSRGYRLRGRSHRHA